MYLVTFESAVESYYGPFDHISLDYTRDSVSVFACTTPDGRIIYVPAVGKFDIVKDNYLK